MCYKDLLSRLIDPATGKMLDFESGYFTGVMVSLAVILLLLFLRVVIGIMLLPRSCKGIEIKEADGDVLISADAVSDLIRALQPEFKHIAMNKIRLYRRGRRQRAVLHVSFDTEGGGMTEQRQRLKERVKEVLGTVLGIYSLTEVAVHCAKISVTGELPRTSPVLDEKDLIQDVAPEMGGRIEKITLEADK